MRTIMHSVLFVFLVAVSIYAVSAQRVSPRSDNKTIDIFSVGRSLPDVVPSNEIEYMGSPYPENEQGTVEDNTTQKYGNSPEYTSMPPSHEPSKEIENIAPAPAPVPKIAPDTDGSDREEHLSSHKVPMYANDVQDNNGVRDIPSIIYPPSEFVDTVNDTDSDDEAISKPEIASSKQEADTKNLEDQKESEKPEMQNPSIVPFDNNEGYEVVETTPRTPSNTKPAPAIPQSLPEEIYAQDESGADSSVIAPTVLYPEDDTNADESDTDHAVIAPTVLYPEDDTNADESDTDHAVITPTVLYPENDTHASDLQDIADNEYGNDKERVQEATIAAQEPEKKVILPPIQNGSMPVMVVASLLPGQFIQLASSKDASRITVLYNSVNLQSDSVLAPNNLIRIWKNPSSEYFRLIIGPFNISEIGVQLYTWRQYYSDAFTYSP